jgi:hypothetical protein
MFLMGVPGLIDDIREAHETPISELIKWRGSDL